LVHRVAREVISEFVTLDAAMRADVVLRRATSFSERLSDFLREVLRAWGHAA